MRARSLAHTAPLLAALLAACGTSRAAEAPIVFDLRPAEARVQTAPPKPKPRPQPRPKPRSSGERAAAPARTHASPAPSRTRVASRGVDANTMVGRIGTIVVPNTPIFDGPYQKKIYNRCAVGQPVILTGWNSQWYGVRMVDGRTGWVYRGYVQLSDAAIRIPEVQARRNRDGSAADGIELVGVHPLLRVAFSYMGIPYKWGGTSASGIDCSGFVRSVFRKFGQELPRVARDQARVGVSVPPTPQDLKPGDRLYFACHHSYIDHTGIYWGNGLFIHSSGGRGVDITPLWDNGTYEKGLVSARRTFAPLEG